MSEPTHHATQTNAILHRPKHPYMPPTLKVYGDLSRLTQSLKNLSGVDGHPGNGMSKTG
jgi:hypothetical protein